MATLVRTLTGQSQKSGQSKDGANLGPPQLSRMTTTNTQTGVLNHLSPDQIQLLDDFKELLQKEGWWAPDGINGKPTHDDGTLLYVARGIGSTSNSANSNSGASYEPASSIFKEHLASSQKPRNG